MFARLLVLFICIPLIELMLLIQIGRLVGLGPTIALVVLTGFLGASLARQQGFRVWAKIQSELHAGRMPAGDLVDGLLILVGGIVLITPGLLTDLCGFALMIPSVRRWVKARVEKRFRIVSDRYRPGPGGDVIDV